MRGWVRNPHSGGSKIPKALQVQIRQRLLEHAAKHYGGTYARLDIRFRGSFCYIDAYREPDPKAEPPRGLGETRAEFRERLRKRSHPPVPASPLRGGSVEPGDFHVQPRDIRAERLRFRQHVRDP